MGQQQVEVDRAHGLNQCDQMKQEKPQKAATVVLLIRYAFKVHFYHVSSIASVFNKCTFEREFGRPIRIILHGQLWAVIHSIIIMMRKMVKMQIEFGIFFRFFAQGCVCVLQRGPTSERGEEWMLKMSEIPMQPKCIFISAQNKICL